MKLFDDRYENNELRKVLQDIDGVTLSNEKIQEIIAMFWFQDEYQSLISYYTYIDTFKDFLIENNRQDWKRKDFYEYLFEEIFSANSYLRAFTKLALSLEIKQSVDLPEQDFTNLLAEIKLTKDDLGYDYLLSKNILKRSEVKEKDGTLATRVGLFHHTLSEFAVAKAFLEKENTIEVFDKVAVYNPQNETTRVLIPSWTGVLKFLLESSKSNDVLDWLLSLIDTNIDNLTDQVAEITTKLLDPSIISSETKTKIFDVIYNTYFDRRVWLPYWVGEELGKFADSNQVLLLKERILETSPHTEAYIDTANIIAITDGMIKYKNPLILPDITFWKDQFIKGANDDNNNGVLQRHSLSALENFVEEVELIENTKKAWTMPDQLVREAFLQMCFTIAPNDEKTFYYLVEAIRGKYGIYGRIGLYQITAPTMIKKLITSFADDLDLLEAFLDKESIYVDENQKSDDVLITHIKEAISVDESIVGSLKRLVEITVSQKMILRSIRLSYSYFLQQIHKTISENDPNFVFSFIKLLTINKKEIHWQIRENANYIAVYLTRENEAQVLESISLTDDYILNLWGSVISAVKIINKDFGEELHAKYN